METLRYPIGIGELNSLLPSRRLRVRVNSLASARPIPFQLRRAPRFSSVRFKPFDSRRRSSSDLRCSGEHHHDHHCQDHHDRDFDRVQVDRQPHVHHHHHHHCGGDCGEESELTEAQRAILRFAKAVRWTDLADFLREHLHLCCGSAAMFLAAAACPHLLPKTAVKPLQNALIVVGFPLVGVGLAVTCLSNFVVMSTRV